jgi:Ca-activated chloride channel family protein
MTERDLDILKKLPVPPAREDARRRAAEAALAAFDDETEKTARAQTQGSNDDTRPTPRSHPATRRPSMTFTRSQYALAASLAALMIAAPAAFQIMNRDGGGPGSTLLEGGERADPAPAKPGSGTLANETRGLVRDKDEFAAGAAGGKQQQTGESRVADVPPPAPPPVIEEKSKTAAQPATSADTKLTKKLDEGRLVRTMPTDGLGVTAGHSGLSAAPIVGGQLLNAPASMDRRAASELAYAIAADHDEALRQPSLTEQEYRDKFQAKEINPVKQVSAEPISTFSIDVDTASYSFVRRALNAGRLPPKDAVRVEEMINYFPYAYPRPETAEQPFQPTVTVMPSPWNASNKLVHVAIKGYDIKSAERPRANLVFLMDVSGSMQGPDRLDLVKNAFRMLVDELKPDDTVAIVTYASGSGVLLEPTKISDKSKIVTAIDKLGAGGSTAGAEGIQDAYRLAESNFDKAAVNRVILATDGDFNVGVTNHDELKGLIERKRDKGIFLSIVGVGQGNYNDSLMQTLAQNGNGTAAYVDTLNEARKVLVDESSSTLFTIAKDVKIQIEWNSARIAEYRLIGYETRALKREDFNNDKVDAGDIGSGHTVTAIYEVTPAGAPALVDDLRYGNGQKTAAAERIEPAVTTDAKSGEIGFLKLRYKLPKEDASKLTTLAITDTGTQDRMESPEVRFSVAVAAFGQLLKGAPYLKSYTFDDVISLAQSAKGDDPFGYRAEFINLVRLAKSAQP